MNRNCCLTMLIILSSFFVTPVHAAKDAEFIEFLAKKVFDACQGSDIRLKDKLVKRTSTGEFITEIRWPYSPQELSKFFEFISKEEPFDSYVENRGGKVTQGVGKDGAGFLSCGGHVLDINKYDYYWDKIKIELPGQVFNLSPGSSYKKTEGNQSPIIEGAYNQVEASKRDFNLQLSIPLGLSLAFNLYLSVQLKRCRQHNRLRGKNSTTQV